MKFKIPFNQVASSTIIGTIPTDEGLETLIKQGFDPSKTFTTILDFDTDTFIFQQDAKEELT